MFSNTPSGSKRESACGFSSNEIAHEDNVNCPADSENLKDPILVKGIPVLGNALSMMKNPARFLYKCHRKYGPVYRIRLMNELWTVLAGVEAANFIGTRKGADLLSANKIWKGMNGEFGCKHILLGEDGKTHQNLRMALRHGYSKEALSYRYNDLVRIIDPVIARDWPSGQLVSVVKNVRSINMEQIGWVLRGVSSREHIDNIHLLVRYIFSSQIMPYAKLLLKCPKYKRAKENVLQLTNHMITEYQHNKDARDPKYRNLIDDIMETHTHNPDLIPASDLNISLIGPFLGGTDTVVMTISAFIYQVLKQPEVHSLICNEADALFAKGSIDEVDLLNLTATNSALMETMRMHPIVPVQIRDANCNFAFLGYRIRAGERLCMAVTVPHFMEEYYQNPDTFDISRYNKPRNEHLKPGVYSPFGKGPHTCIGQTFAKVQMLLTIAQLFYNLELELESADYQLLSTWALPLHGPSEKFRVRVKGRRH